MSRLYSFLLLLSILHVYNVIISTTNAVSISQFEYYSSIVSLWDERIENEYLNLTSGCIYSREKDVEKRGSPPRYCKGQRNGKHTTFQSWNNYSVRDGLFPPERDCDYHVFEVPKQVDTTVSFRIEQVNCKSKKNSRGGSSFDVFTQMHTAASPMLPCNIKDWFNSTYSVTCSLNDGGLEKGCAEKISLLGYVDYEHFDAFNELVSFEDPLRVLVINTTMTRSCTSTVSIRDNTAPLGLARSPTAQQGSDTLPPSHLSAQDVRRCTDRLSLPEKPVYLIGSSHQRYLWDNLALACLDGDENRTASTLLSTKSLHHPEISIGDSFHYIPRLFTMSMLQTIRDVCRATDLEDGLRSSEDGLQSSENHTESSSSLAREGNVALNKSKDDNAPNKVNITDAIVIIEQGAWDLYFLPVRNIIRFHAAGPAIANLFSHWHEDPCSHRVRLVLMTAVPFPLCVLDETKRERHKRACEHLDRGYRNDYAIQAYNEWLLEQINANHIHIGGGKSARQRVDVIDAHALIYPHRHFSVCRNHFQCVLRNSSSSSDSGSDNNSKNNNSKDKDTEKDKDKKSTSISISPMLTPGGEVLLNFVIHYLNTH